MTKEVEERLKQLRANLNAEPNQKGLYAQDLKASIKSCEEALKTGGYLVVSNKLSVIGNK